MDNAAVSLRPMGIIDQIDATFRLYRRNLVTFTGIVALVQIPWILFALAESALITLPALRRYTDALSDPAALDSSRVLQNVLLTFCGTLGIVTAINVALSVPASALMSGALARAISNAYLGRPADIFGSYGFMLKRWRLVKLMLTSLLLSLGAIILLFIPCIGWAGLIYLGVRLVLVPQAIVLEDRAPVDALQRTWDLEGGQMLRAFGLLALSYGIGWVLSSALSYFVGLAAQAGAGALHLPAEAASLFQSGFSGVISLIWMPVSFGALTLFYYDLRMRKEGFDLQLKLDQVAPPAPSVSTAPLS